MPTDWYRKRKQEGFYRAAKREGYRSRSAYKLQQIANRFKLLGRGEAVVDLGAAPGGWSQVAAERVGPEGVVVAVDLVAMRPIEGVDVVQGDMTEDATAERVQLLVESRTGGRKVQAVISDMSPKLSGTRDMDVANSEYLCRKALQFSDRVLERGGTVVLKIFEGAGFQEFRDELKGLFATVRPYNPPASEKRSAELYLVCTGWKGVGST